MPARLNEPPPPLAAPTPVARPTFAHVLRTLAAVVLLAALIMAPLNYGSTRPAPFLALVALTAAGGAVWLLSAVISRTAGSPPTAMCLGAALVAVVVLLWLAVFPANEIPAFSLRHFARVVARWPHSVTPHDPALLAAWAGVAVLALFAWHDIARDPFWRACIATVVAATGAVVALLGLMQNATHARGIFWDGSIRMPGAFFGPFFHHTSAGAYLNTAWPLGLAAALVAIRTRSSAAGIAVVGLLLCSTLVLAAHAGHVSRLPQVVAAVVLCAFALWTGLWRALDRVRGLRGAVGLAAAAVVVALFVLNAGRVRDIRSRWAGLEWSNLRGGAVAATPPPVARWPRLMRDDLFIPSDHRNYPLGDRGAAYATALAAVADRPWFGWGPGGWMAAAAANSIDPFTRTFFLMLQFTHQDYLQVCVEWGLVGALGWALLIPAGGARALWRLRLRPARDFIGAGAVAALAAVLLQSLIDFPLQIPAVQLNAIALAALAWSVPPPAVSA